VTLGDSQPLWLGCWLLAKAKAAKNSTKGTLNSTLPMLCMGDLNEIMHANEKLGPNCVDINRMNAFCMYVKQ
jgi:hypothetical protein